MKQFFVHTFFISFFLAFLSCNAPSDNPINNLQSISQIVREANVFYDSAFFQTGYMHVPPYISNGIIGGCFDHMGFQSRANKGVPNGRTVIGYVGQYYMHKPTTRQAQVPLAYIEAGFTDGSTILNMMETTDYKQELDIYSGVLTTEYDLFGKTKITTFAHQTIPNLMILKIDRKSISPEKNLVLKIKCQTAPTQSDMRWAPENINLKIDVLDNRADIISSTNMVETRWSVISNNAISKNNDELIIPLIEKENLIKIVVHREDTETTALIDQSFDALLQTHVRAWAQNWEKSYINFPEQRANNIWNRANYYNLSNFPVIPEKALIPTGMNTNIWGFTFPQDVYYVVENLLRSGHFDRYEKSMQYWLDILPEVKKYSVRIMDVEGGFYPWTPPFDQWDEYEKHGAVGNDSYEIHNPAYVAAMVWHYYQRTGDIRFLSKYFPVMEEVWRFYTNVIHQNDEGTYDINHHKAAGQDEASKLESSKNLLCASYSAEYTARNYIKAAKLVKEYDNELLEKAEKILTAGLERDKLLNTKGYYVTYEGDERPSNSQKHPVQLNAIAFCPMEDLGTADPAIKAWENRYELTTEAKKPISHGWTYGEFSLASSRLGKPDALAKDLTAAQYCSHADPMWIQFFEFTFWERWTLSTAYYFPTHGLYQQALTDAIVQDWRGYTEVFAAVLDTWKNEKIQFRGMYTLNGISIDGEREANKVKLIIHPNGASEIKLKVSSVSGKLNVEGIKGNITELTAGELVTLEFDEGEEILIWN